MHNTIILLIFMSALLFNELLRIVSFKTSLVWKVCAVGEYCRSFGRQDPDCHYRLVIHPRFNIKRHLKPLDQEEAKLDQLWGYVLDETWEQMRKESCPNENRMTYRAARFSNRSLATVTPSKEGCQRVLRYKTDMYLWWATIMTQLLKLRPWICFT